MNTSTSSATIEKLRMAFTTHGLPEIVVTDNGSNFVSKEFEEFLKQNGIRHIRTAAYHPASKHRPRGKENKKKLMQANIVKNTGHEARRFKTSHAGKYCNQYRP